MGTKAPAFLGDVKSFFFIRIEGSQLSMQCNAQGHPIPIYRYEKLDDSNAEFSFPVTSDRANAANYSSSTLALSRFDVSRGTLSEGLGDDVYKLTAARVTLLFPCRRAHGVQSACFFGRR